MKHFRRVKVYFIFFVLMNVSFIEGICQFDQKAYCISEKQNIERIIDGKFYVLPGSVYVAENEIYINHENKLIPVSSLFSDSQGVYVKLVDVPEIARTWICDVCYWENPSYLRYCQNCGNDRPKSK